MPRAVMALSSRYPQLLCILMRFSVEMRAATAIRIARIMLNDARTRAIFINSKPRIGLADGGQGPLSGADAPCSARRRGSSAKGSLGMES
jgi:hypothetical protein